MSEQKSTETRETRPETAEAPRAELTQALDFLSRWNAELVTFYAQRYQQYGLLPLRLLACSSPEDFQDLQRTFLARLAADYREEAATLSQIAGSATFQADTTAQADYAASLQKAQEDAAAILEEAKAQAERIVASAEKQARALTEPPEEKERKRA